MMGSPNANMPNICDGDIAGGGGSPLPGPVQMAKAHGKVKSIGINNKKKSRHFFTRLTRRFSSAIAAALGDFGMAAFARQIKAP